MFFLLALKVLEYDSACLQMYTTSKGFRFFFSFKSHKSSNDEDIITIPWYNLQRSRLDLFWKNRLSLLKQQPK